MEQFSYVIKDELGIHARPAGLLVKEVDSYSSSVIISVNGNQTPANKLFGIMSLGVEQGDEVVVTVEGEDEQVAVMALKDFFEQNL